MAGLLDSLQDPNNALALSLLAAGAPTTDPNASGFGARLNGAVVQATDKTLRQQQAAATLFAAKQKAALLSLAMQGAGGDPNAATSPGAVLGAAPSQAQGGAVGSPGAVVAPNPAPAGLSSGGMPAGSPGAVMGPPAALPAGSPGAGLFNPRTAALLKLGGEADILPNIQAMNPKLEIHDGVLWDMNPITNPSGQPRGFALSKSTSADGKSVINMADGSTIAAPGAVATFGAFEDRSNESKAKNTESRQPLIGPSGRPVSQSVYDAVRGITPPAAGGAAFVAAPRAQIGPGAGYSSPGGLAGGNTATAADGQRDILTSELAKTQQTLAQAQAAGDAQAVARAQQDIAGIQRELGRLPNAAPAPAPIIGPGAGGLPPPSPVVANSGSVPGRTNFLAVPGQGVGVTGGTGYNPTEQAAQKAAAAGAEEQAKLQAKAENNPAAFMAEHYPEVAKAADGTAATLENLKIMRDAAAARTVTALPIPGPMIGAIPSNVNASMDAYNKARGNVIDTMKARSDAAQANIDVAIPQYGVDKGVQLHAIDTQMGQVRAKQITQQILSPLQTQAKGPEYVQTQAALAQNLTPPVANMVAPILSMPKSPARDAAIQAARKDPAAEAVLRAAILSGALK